MPSAAGLLNSLNSLETSQLICSANLLTGFYIMATLAFNELSIYEILVDNRHLKVNR